MRFLIWNIRGMCGPGNQALVNKVVHETNPILLGLVETKNHNAFEKKQVQSWWRPNDVVSWEEVPAKIKKGRSGTGKKGGLIISWKNNDFQRARCFKGRRWILLEGKLLEHNFDVAFLLVYASTDGTRRQRLYERLSKKIKKTQFPIMAFGDFNSTLEPYERKGNHVPTTSYMKQFQGWINRIKSDEVSMKNRYFTWYEHTKNQASKIDRVFIQEQWSRRFKDIKAWGLETCTSDHRAMLIGCDSEDWVANKRKRFSKIEFKIDLLKKVWKPYQIKTKVNQNLGKMELHIRRWNSFFLEKILKDLKEWEDALKRSDDIFYKADDDDADLLRIFKNMKNELVGLKVALEKVDFNTKNLDVRNFVRTGIALEKLNVELKDKHINLSAAGTDVLRWVKNTTHKLDKLDLFIKNSQVSNDEVAQSIEIKLDYLRIRIDHIDIHAENSNTDLETRNQRTAFCQKLNVWLTMKERYVLYN